MSVSGIASAETAQCLGRGTLRNQRQSTAFLVQTVRERWELGFDFAASGCSGGLGFRVQGLGSRV
eukprot:3940651-Rhodomonas_salina.5